MQRLRDLERLDLARGFVDGPFLHEEAAVEQHPDGLDRVQRYPLGPRQDLLTQVLRKAWHQPLEQLFHRPLRERLQIERGEVALAGAPGGMSLLQLRTSERDHVERVVARPFEQVLDEVEQARVRPLHVLEGEHRRIDLGQPLEEQPPGREEILPVTACSLLQTEEMREARLDERPLLPVEQVLLEGFRELVARGGGLLVLPDQAAHPHHVGQRPVGDAFAVGETAASVPVDLFDDPVEVLVELPDQARLADPGEAGNRDQMRSTLLGAAVEEILDQLHLAVATDERRLQPGRLERPADTRDDP